MQTIECTKVTGTAIRGTVEDLKGTQMETLTMETFSMARRMGEVFINGKRQEKVMMENGQKV